MNGCLERPLRLLDVESSLMRCCSVFSQPKQLNRKAETRKKTSSRLVFFSPRMLEPRPERPPVPDVERVIDPIPEVQNPRQTLTLAHPETPPRGHGEEVKSVEVRNKQKA